MANCCVETIARAASATGIPAAAAGARAATIRLADLRADGARFVVGETSAMTVA